MAKAMYVGVDNKARKVKKMYVGIGGVARKVKKAYNRIRDRYLSWKCLKRCGNTCVA
jgi:hypothetical protein